MFNSAVLEIAIGMAFLYSFLSLITTAANELIASWLRLRSTNLAQGVENLVGAKYAEKLYQHPLINVLGKSGEKPSYLPPKLFVTALLDILREEEKVDDPNSSLQVIVGKLSDGDLNKALKLMAQDVDKDINEFKADVEMWFNSAMDRVSGWYKRRVQLNLLIISAVGTVALNVDSVAIINRLSIDSTLRESLVNQARDQRNLALPSGEMIDDEKAITIRRQQFNSLLGDLKGMRLPIGWIEESEATSLTHHLILPEWPWTDNGESLWEVIVTHFFGWLITILAVSLGAPFWFDLLNKVINIRAAGKAPEEYPKRPKELPKPEASVSK